MVYGSVEEQVMAYAVEYFFITSLSFPFLGIYNAGAGAFPGYGKLKYFNGYFHRDECAEHIWKLFLFSALT